MADYQREWEDYRRWKNRLLSGLFRYIPITFAFGQVLKRFFDVEWPVFIIAIAWILLFANAGIRLQSRSSSVPDARPGC